MLKWPLDLHVARSETIPLTLKVVRLSRVSCRIDGPSSEENHGIDIRMQEMQEGLQERHNRV